MATNNGVSDEHPMATPALFKRDEAEPEEAIFYGCGYCSQVFHTKAENETHIRLFHAGAPYVCVPAPLNPDQAELLHVPHTTLFAEGIPLSELARHNTPEDCWVAMNGKVYDMTEFLDRHPGGRSTITSWAGKDCSAFFNGIHQASWINQYLRPEAYLGELGIKENMMSEGYWEQLRQVRVSELKEELHYFCDEDAAEETAAPMRALQGMQLSSDKVQARLNDLEARLQAAVKAENFAEADDIKKVIDKLKRQAEAPAVVGTGGAIPLSEVAKHNKIKDCWVALHGKVLDLTDFLANNHEGRNPILAMAGRDATPTFNKIRGRFPSEEWNEEFMRPEMVIGDVAKTVPLSHHDAKVKELRQELRMLEGPSEAEKAAMNAAAQAAKDAQKAAAGGNQKGEDDRFPKLKDIRASHGAVPLFTRAEVAEHTGASADMKPYIIVHNKVYDLTPLLGGHPGGDEVLLSRAGTDCTMDFEVFEHSEKSRVKRDQDMLVGELHPDERKDMAAEAGAAGAAAEVAAPASETELYLRWKAYDAAILITGVYLYRTLQHTKPLPSMMYSRMLRHLHAIMAAGIFATVGTAQAAARADGKAKKQYLKWHKQTGILMLFAILVRMVVRLRSGIPPRFPGFKAVQAVETQSLRVFYALALALPVSGVAYEWFTYWAPAFQKEEDKEADERNERLAKQSIIAHRYLGKFLEYAWLPFHLGYTTMWHASQGRGVIRKVNPFI